MSLKRQKYRSGSIVRLRHSSEVLKGNLLKDPHQRDLIVWLPPDYSADSPERYPVAYDLAGYTGSGPGRLNWKPFGENMPQRLERLLGQAKIGPMIVVFPDCYTALGGNQYLNSSALGAYEDYLNGEIVPFVDESFKTLAHSQHRACFGKSSGGYGAMVQGMRHPDIWGAIANLSGDSYFDFIYRRDWPSTLDTLAKYRHREFSEKKKNKKEKNNGELIAKGMDDGRISRFLKSVWSREKISYTEGACLMSLCMAASYDPDPKAPLGFRVPFNLDTGELLEKRWERWLSNDPIHMVTQYRKNLKKLKGIWLECGTRDQYFIHYGSRLLSMALSRAGIGHIYEEFDDNHSDLDYRLDQSLPFLYSRIKA